MSRTVILREGPESSASSVDLIEMMETSVPTKDQIATYANQLNKPTLSLGAASDALLGLATAYLRDNRPDEAISLV